MSAADRGFLLHVFHRTQGPDTVIFGVGRLESGGTFAFADNRDSPAFYVRAGDAATARVCAGRDTVEPCGWTTMDGEPVVRVRSRRVNGLRQVARRLHEDEVRTYEADVGLGRRYLADRGIAGPVEISGPWRPGTGVDRVYVDPELEPGDWVPGLSVLALDIETTPDASEVLAASLVGSGTAAGVEEVHISGAPDPGDPDYLSCHDGEGALLTALGDRIRALDPDVLTGWNLVDFDLTVLQRRFRALALPFNLGRSSDSSWYQVAQGISLAAVIPTAISATTANLRRGYVDGRLAATVTPAAFVLAVVGALVAGELDSDTLSRIFGVVVLYVGGRTLFSLWRRSRASAAPVDPEPAA